MKNDNMKMYFLIHILSFQHSTFTYTHLPQFHPAFVGTTLNLNYPQIFLYLFESSSFCFRHHAPDKNQVEQHNTAEKDKCIVPAVGDLIHEDGKCPGDDGGHDPM